MNTNFFNVLGCKFCLVLKQANISFNSSSPIDKKFYPIDIHSGDPRMNLLNSITPGNQYHIPTTIILNKNSKIALFSSSSLRYSTNFLKLFLGGITLNLI